MSTIINGTTDAITFPDATIQNTSAIVSGYVPYANLPAGSVLQVVTTTLPSVVSTSAASVGTFYAVSGLTVNITPKFSTSKILVLLDANMCSSSDSDQGVMYQITRGGSAIDIGDAASARSRVTGVTPNGGNVGNVDFAIPKVSCVYLDSPATTSSTTYGVSVCSTSSSRTVYLNRTYSDTDNNYSGRSSSTITVMEIAA
jgi:hypothetical protein